MSNTPPHALVEICVVIPAYNEATRISQTIDSVNTHLSSHYKSFEILVVDDGSRDSTSQVVRKLQESNPQLELIILERNRGKGYAVRHGILNARGSKILFNDADGASPIGELIRLEQAMEKGADIAIGSRGQVSSDTQVDTIIIRKFLGRSFNMLINLIILPGIYDTQCGFKLFKRGPARVLFRNQKSDRFSFDVEVLFLARRAGLTIAEVPINWHYVEGSKVNLLKSSFLNLRDILWFRLKDILKIYPSSEQLSEELRKVKD